MNIRAIHMVDNKTMKSVLWTGVWWPTLKTKIHDYVLQCLACKIKFDPLNPMPFYFMFS